MKALALLSVRLCLSIFLVLSSLGVSPALSAEAPGTPAAPSIQARAEKPADIEAFVRKGCPNCAQAKIFLDQLSRERPQLVIVIRDVQEDAGALKRLKQLAERNPGMAIRVPAFLVHDHLIVGYSEAAGSSRLITAYLAGETPQAQPQASGDTSCEAEQSLSCGPEAEAPAAAAPVQPESFSIDFFGRRISLDDVGLPAFTLAMGLLDGFNPCSMWVLLLMISLLAPMRDRWRMVVIAGTFVAVEGIAYFIFMAAWLNLFLFIGLSRISEIAIGAIALLAGLLNVKDFWAFGKGPSLSIPQSAKPDIYARIRGVLQAQNLTAAIIGVITLAVLVQIVEFLCTSGFPALFTRILTLHQMEGPAYYGYLLLYNAAYMLDDVIVLSIGVVSLSQHRLQEREGRWLKLMSGVVMLGLAAYLFLRPG